MLRKILISLTAAAILATSFAPVEADARDRRGYYDRDHRDYDRRGRHRDRDDDGDAAAAAVVGLVLGVAIGALASQSRDRQCRQNCGPPPRYYQDQRDSGYYQDDPRYPEDSAYAREYGLQGGDDYYAQEEQCVRQERQWDRYANRYLVVEVPC